jgi:Concanavalin A-like lectin/glucanases superfamily
MRRGGRRVSAFGFVVAMVAVVPAASAQTMLVYGMDETSGTTMVGAGGAPSGAISGDVTLGVSGATGAAGDAAYAFNQNVGSCDASFNVSGTGSVVIPSSSVFAVGTQPFRFSVWVKTTTVPGADSGATANCDFDVVRRSSRWKLELLPKGTSPNRYGAPHCAWKGVLSGVSTSVRLTAKTSDVTDGNWHQVTCARTATGEQVIVDGTVKAASTVNLGAINSTAKIYVARNPSADDYYQGQLDDLTFNIG